MQPIQQRQEPAKVFPAGELLVGDRSPRGIAMPQITRYLWKKRNGRIRLRFVTP